MNDGTGNATRPNLLIIMADEHAPQFSSTYGHPIVRTPNLDRLAADGVTFDAAYCNSPLCVPSRMSFMTGRYVHEIRAYDNCSPLASDVPTWAHMLGAVGYDVALAGKQHFVGPDQLHGFHAQLARDIHAELSHRMYRWDDGITPPAQPWRHMVESGPGTTAEIEADDAVEDASLAYLREAARAMRPWVLNASFIAPHFPFIVPEQYWNMYPVDEVDLPAVPDLSEHPVYQRFQQAFGLGGYTEEQIRRARAGYYGLATYLDDKVGRLLDVLEETGQADNTLVVYTADHGEMNGEHGLWRKSCFYEESARVPLIMRWPGQVPRSQRRGEVVSLVDLTATIVDAAEADSVRLLSGDSVLQLAHAADPGWKDEAFAEYLAHGVTGPMAMLRRGRYKLNYSHGDPPELYDIVDDPHELTDLAGDPSKRGALDTLRNDLLSRWDAENLNTAVRQSQRERSLIRSADPQPLPTLT